MVDINKANERGLTVWERDAPEEGGSRLAEDGYR